MEGTTTPREDASAAAAARAAPTASAAGGASSPRAQGVSSASPPSPRGGVISRMWETLSGSPKADATLASSPPSPGRAMKGRDVWEKGTGVTHFKGSDRYDKPAPPGPGVHRAPSVEEILAPCYSTGRGPPSYESKESYDKGPMVPQ